MITNSSQNWAPGSTVKVGFMRLVVKAAVQTPGDFAPDAYLCTSLNGAKLYKFVPHKGVSEISIFEAADLLEAQQARAEATAEKALQNAQNAAAISKLFR